MDKVWAALTHWTHQWSDVQYPQTSRHDDEWKQPCGAVAFDVDR